MALRSAKANIAAWSAEIEADGLDGIVINASGCGTQVKDYGFMLRDDQAWTGRARAVSELARDVSEVLADLELSGKAPVAKLRVAYHAACSLQHGQKLTGEAPALLRQAGFEVLSIPEGHLCCGSAGTYNILQPELADRLKAHKLAHIQGLGADVIAAGNIGCMEQLSSSDGPPVVHTVELLDWATGGPEPKGFSRG